MILIWRLVVPIVVITATACRSRTTMTTTVFLSNFFTVAHDVGNQDTVRPVLLGQQPLKVAARLVLRHAVPLLDKGFVPHLGQLKLIMDDGVSFHGGGLFKALSLLTSDSPRLSSCLRIQSQLYSRAPFRRLRAHHGNVRVQRRFAHTTQLPMAGPHCAEALDVEAELVELLIEPITSAQASVALLRLCRPTIAPAFTNAGLARRRRLGRLGVIVGPVAVQVTVQVVHLRAMARHVRTAVRTI
jgi:hypothetical protein